ncbi:1850_t:CDS:2 [Diversispora eburnea]|uniref:1850_t:CDS:1 n=1 Tax=Diversispora eburnea TaxID=1213867 RepID=A0A9N8ZHL9_9GLOM|nr:1850_t:CDS:2 [Diversispora eburnea]
MIIIVGEEPYTKTFYVHSNILRVRSNYFKTFLSTNWIRREDDKIRFSKPNIEPEVFAIILEYIYGGKIEFQEDLDPSIIFDCIKAADELGILEFLFYSQDYLLNNKITWLKENLVLIYRDSFGLDSMRKLQEFSVDRIKKYPHLLFDSEDFNMISEQALIAVIKDDKLEMEEIEIWKKLLKWGIIEELANKYKMSMKKKLPNRGAAISTIMSSDHAAIIASWIDHYDIFVGGYNPDVWYNTLWPQYKRNDRSFIFSFTQGITINDNHAYALNCWRSSGPSFGKFDLLMQNSNLRFKHKTYVPNVMPVDDKSLKIDDYEIFEVVLKETIKNGEV